MIAYHGDPLVKQKYVERFAAHRKADDVVQGTGYNNGKGCFVGCCLDAYDHARFPVELGWPEWLARLADTIFEGLPAATAPQFGTDLLDVVQVGADLNAIRIPFLLRLQRRNLARLESNSALHAPQVRGAIEQVIAALVSEDAEELERSAAEVARAVTTMKRAELERSAAEVTRAVAVAAAAAAARAAARAVAARAAEWSAEAVAEAAEAAAVAAEWSSVAAESEAQRDDLLGLLGAQA